MTAIFDLTGKAALVTGGARGLGRAMAEGLARAGADVAVTDIVPTDGVVAELKKTGNRAAGIRCDVRKPKDVEKAVAKAVKELKGLDILVNNAGIYTAAPAEDATAEDWKKVIDVNLTGQFFFAREAGKYMIKKRSGKIINVSSVAGLFGSAESAAYCASKAGVILLTKTLAVEWGRFNIQVNAICPGLFATAMTEEIIKDKEYMAMVKARVPLSRCGLPPELAGTAVYLASHASDYMTGHALVIDGGWTAGL